jgi:NAD(P)-dependent dehydrogenase (short-subunit alcohol dehydrogenase family)
MNSPRDLTSSTVLVTGANRGLGRALVDALVDAGVPKIYAAARDPQGVRRHPRIVAVPLNITDAPSVLALAGTASDVDVLINNAGVAAFAPALEADPDAVAHELAVNYTGLHTMIRAFAPTLVARRGALVNLLTLLSLAPAPPMAGYSASKAAAHSLTLALRPSLTAAGVGVHAVYPAGIDTDMLAGVDGPKADPAAVAAAVLAGVTAGDETIFPDEVSRQMGKLWAGDPRAFEAQFAAMGG